MLEKKGTWRTSKSRNGKGLESERASSLYEKMEQDGMLLLFVLIVHLTVFKTRVEMPTTA